MTYSIIPLHFNAKDITGQVFSRLTAIAPVGRTKAQTVMWLCICECGTEATPSTQSLIGGHTRSCGCLGTDIRRKNMTTHGMRKHHLYTSWKNMRNRCNNQNNQDYHSYGGRGIRVCNRWDDFGLFVKDMKDRPEGLTLDRIDNDSDYSPENCKWSTPKEQANNRRPQSVSRSWRSRRNQPSC